jgi:hypothetical protein
VLNTVWVGGLLHVLLGALAAGLAVALIREVPRWRSAQRAWSAQQSAPVPSDAELLAARWDRMDRWQRDAPAPPPAHQEPLPVGADGRLAPDDLRAWLAARGSEAPGPR